MRSRSGRLYVGTMTETIGGLVKAIDGAADVAATPHEIRALNLLPIYQVWACRRAATSAAPSMAFTRPPMDSTIVPTYNRPERLRIALESVNAQQYQDFEVIVVNYGTVPVESVVEKMNVAGRMTLVNHDHNRGLAASRNTGLRLARGTYIAYLDDDDRFLPDHLGTLVGFLEGGTHQVAYTDAWRVIEREVDGVFTEAGRDRPHSSGFAAPRLLVENYIHRSQSSCTNRLSSGQSPTSSRQDRRCIRQKTGM